MPWVGRFGRRSVAASHQTNLEASVQRTPSPCTQRPSPLPHTKECAWHLCVVTLPRRGTSDAARQCRRRPCGHQVGGGAPGAARPLRAATHPDTPPPWLSDPNLMLCALSVCIVTRCCAWAVIGRPFSSRPHRSLTPNRRSDRRSSHCRRRTRPTKEAPRVRSALVAFSRESPYFPTPQGCPTGRVGHCRPLRAALSSPQHCLSHAPSARSRDPAGTAQMAHARPIVGPSQSTRLVVMVTEPSTSQAAAIALSDRRSVPPTRSARCSVLSSFRAQQTGRNSRRESNHSETTAGRLLT